MEIKKKIKIGKMIENDKEYDINVTIHIHGDDAISLSMVGSIGSACVGQINEDLRRFIESGDVILDKNISRDMVMQLLDIWDNWHLNDMNAACEHQKLLVRHLYKNGLEYKDVINYPEIQMCPICGYSYGTEWKFMRIPDYVLIFLINLLS